MCNRCGGGRINVFFPSSTKQCDCSNQSTPTYQNYIPYPEGGDNGNVLVKQGNKIVWAEINSVLPTFNNTVEF